jgi:hypothetical protein
VEDCIVFTFTFTFTFTMGLVLVVNDVILGSSGTGVLFGALTKFGTAFTGVCSDLVIKCVSLFELCDYCVLS